ncbi:MAG: peptidoglycan-binding domain-containing protein [Rhodobacter sp.]|nr:peptidoglycan-binding domain-containing protein [Rhodobacter sp.]MCY4240550.1 peptidoglycan-binding domain-containing protein [Rhodobacter sp.]
MTKRLSGMAAILSVALAPALSPDGAWAADDFFGGLVGGIIGGAIGSSVGQQQGSGVRQQPQNTTTRVVRQSPARPNPQREANRHMQTALNYFGFPAGTPDGAVGPRTRSAVAAYQTYMGFPATGQITQFERDILTGAMTAGQAGIPDAMQLVATSPDGARALLVRQRDLMTGTVTASTPAAPRGYPGIPVEVSEAVDEIANSSDPTAEQLLERSGFIQLADLNGDGNNDYILDTSFAGSSFWCSAAQCKSLVFVSTPNGFARNDLLAFSPTPASFRCFGATCQAVSDPTATLAVQPTVPQPEPLGGQGDRGGTVMASATAEPTLPSFGSASEIAADPSLSSHCSKVGLLTSERGGFVEVGAGPAGLALAEQFCLARSFAIDLGERRVAGLAGVTPDQVEAQCKAFEPLLSPMVRRLGQAGHLAVLDDVSSFVVGSGMPPEQLRVTAEACLGVGYRRDTMDLAIGSALLMVALGETPYAELLGHHLSEGFGVESDSDLAADWYRNAVSALNGGATPVFAAELDGRVELLHWAAFDGTERAAVIPTFGSAN